MIKPHVISLERLDGVQFDGQFELQGLMDVTAESDPLEGVRESSLRMSIATALQLCDAISRALRSRRSPA